MARSPIRCSLTSATAFRRVNPDLPILGVEIEKERVDAAQPFADEKTFFRLGGFNLPLKEGEHVRLIRAFNVLRQYEENDFAPAYERLAQVEEFQTILPKNLIHHLVPGEPIHGFFEAWKQSTAEASAVKPYRPRQWFTAAAERLAERGYVIALQRKWLTRGFLIWKPGSTTGTNFGNVASFLVG